MSREEAIETLKLLKPNMRFDDSGWLYTKQALEMAIQALSQEPCELLIIKSDILLHQDDRKKWTESIKREKESGVIILPPYFEPLLVPNDIEINIGQEPCTDAISREEVNTLVDELARAISDERCHIPQRGRDTGHIMQDILDLPSVTQKPVECDDAISRQAALDCFTATKLKKFDFILYAREEIKKLPPVTQKSGKWIALVARPMTNEEREYYSEQLDYCDGDAAVYDCPLPEEGQDVLITTCTGGVLIDTFFNDYDGCGFEGYDIEDVKAWMPLPEPYKPQEDKEQTE